MSEDNVYNLQEKYEALTAPFPPEALKAVPGSAGLTSIKPQYIIERLNTVIGLGNWSHVAAVNGSAGYEDTDKGVKFFGKLVVKDNEGKWTEQSAVGDCARFMDRAKKMEKSDGDIYKAAKTDSLSKCASMFGVGNDVFKGLVAPPGKSSPKASSSSKSNDSDF